METSALIMVVGLPGTGKSTFSRALAQQLGAEHLNSDVIRAELGLRGQYSAAAKAKVYRTLREQTKAKLQGGKSVIVDATLYREDLRQPYAELALELRRPIHWIELRTGLATIKKRVAGKRPFTEADFSVYEKIKALYEPLEQPHLHLETDEATLDALVAEAENYLKHEPTAN